MNLVYSAYIIPGEKFHTGLTSRPHDLQYLLLCLHFHISKFGLESMPSVQIVWNRLDTISCICYDQEQEQRFGEEIYTKVLRNLRHKQWIYGMVKPLVLPILGASISSGRSSGSVI